MEAFALGEFFSGPGGMALGAHHAVDPEHGGDPELVGRVRVEHAWGVDYDSDSVLTYIDNVPGASLRTVHAQDARVMARVENLARLSAIDGFAFGFPCNDFSLVGEHKGLAGEYGGLYRTGLEVLRAKRPKWFVAENVSGIRSANAGSAFRTILNDLSMIDDDGKPEYVLTPHLYKFEEYGVPQKRHRVIVVGIRQDLAANGIAFAVPAPTHGPGRTNAFVSAGEVLNRETLGGTLHTEPTRQAPQVIERLEYIDPGENAFSAASKMPERLRLRVRGATISQIYKRLKEDEPSYTVTGSGGGGTHMYHWSQNRALTNRERARLQTFPDSFNFVGTRDSVRKQIGMAVPVDGARAIFVALFKTLQKIPYDSIDSNIAHLNGECDDSVTTSMFTLNGAG